MALGDGNYYYTTTTGGTNAWTSSGTTWVSPMTVTVGGGGGGGYSTPAPRPKTALDWLDDEIEATCKLARQAA